MGDVKQNIPIGKTCTSAERRIGEFSRELPKAKNQYGKCSPHDGESKTSILKEAGITHPERYEAIAGVFSGYVCACGW